MVFRLRKNSLRGRAVEIGGACVSVSVSVREGVLLKSRTRGQDKVRASLTVDIERYDVGHQPNFCGNGASVRLVPPREGNHICRSRAATVVSKAVVVDPAAVIPNRCRIRFERTVEFAHLRWGLREDE